MKQNSYTNRKTLFTHIRHILFLSIAICLFTVCDKIDGSPYQTGVNNGGEPTLTDKSVLLFEFTGHRCPNCPEAAIRIHELEMSYGSQIIAVAVHAGYFSIQVGTTYSANYQTEFGNALNELVKPSGYPKGVMGTLEGSKQISYGNFETALLDNLAIKTAISIKIDNELNNNTLTTKVTLENVNGEEELISNLAVVSVLVENGIVSPQLNGNEIIEDYEHNHVLRGGLSATIYGDEITFDTNNTFVKNYAKELNETWVKNNMQVVSYVFNTETLDVLQARSAPLQKQN